MKPQHLKDNEIIKFVSILSGKKICLDNKCNSFMVDNPKFNPFTGKKIEKIYLINIDDCLSITPIKAINFKNVEIVNNEKK